MINSNGPWLSTDSEWVWTASAYCATIQAPESQMKPIATTGPMRQQSGRGEDISRRRASSSFNDEHGFVVDHVDFPIFAEHLIPPHRMLQQCVADISCRLAVVLTHDRFQ